MKKFLAILMAILVLSGGLCVTAVAAESDPIVMSLFGLTSDDKIVGLNHWTTFADGWESAVDFACDEDFMEEHALVRIIVDLYADWNANDEGEFGKSSWTGFRYSTIYVPEDAKITINLNSHTINRGLKEDEYDGEVIYVEEEADLIINGGKSDSDVTGPFGTITGGWSCNGAGGISAQDDSRLTLNNVNMIANQTTDDDGSAIAVCDGAELTVNGGSISRNTVNGFGFGAVYVEDATATLNSVLLRENEGNMGLVVYATTSTVTMIDCIVENNGMQERLDHGYSIFLIYGKTDFHIKGGAIRNNGNPSAPLNSLFHVGSVEFNMSEECEVTGNHVTSVFMKPDGCSPRCDIRNCTFTDNDGLVTVGTDVVGSVRMPDTVFKFTACRFNNNNVAGLYDYDFCAYPQIEMTLIDCDLGDTTFRGKEYMVFEDLSNGYTGSLFGEGSMTMVISLLALVSSIASIGVSVMLYKKKADHGATNSESEE